MRILFLSRWYPWPRNNGSKLRIHTLLSILGRHHDVTLISFTELNEGETNAPELLKICRSVRSVPRKTFDPGSLKSLVGLFSSSPRSVIDTRSVEMEEAIKEALKEPFDCVIASQIDMAAYRRLFRGLPAIFEELELGLSYDRYRNNPTLPGKLRRGLTWAKHKRFTTRLLDQFDLVTVASRREHALVTAFCPTSAAVEVIPNVIDLSQYSTTDHNRQPASLIFTGPFCYEPNYHGFVWFQHHVCPLLATRHPELEVIATGDHGGRLIPNPARVTLTGYLPDVKPLLAQATCCIAPLLEAGGTRLKILEAMAMRTPVVATSKGAEGLKAIDGEHLLIADRPGEFANAVTMVLTNPALAQRLSENAHRLVQAEYDVQAVAEQFLDLVQHVSAVPAAPARLTA